MTSHNVLPHPREVRQQLGLIQIEFWTTYWRLPVWRIPHGDWAQCAAPGT